MQSGGFDHEFVPELPNEYICVICHLALRKPKQIEECGHRFCEWCLDCMKSHINARRELQCPIDRETFGDDQTFKDKAAERQIVNWKVKCPNHKSGCEWIGELNTLKNHEKECSYCKGKCCNEKEARIEELRKDLNKSNKEMLQMRSQINTLLKQVKDLSSRTLQPVEERAGRLLLLSEDPSTISTIPSCFEWRCPMFNFSSPNTHRYSPKLYYKQYCFQLLLCPNKRNTSLCIVLCRCRGKFDDCHEKINNELPLAFRFIITLKGKKKSIENFVVTNKNKWIVEAGCIRSKELHKKKSIENFVVTNKNKWIVEAGCIRSKELHAKKLIDESDHSDYIVAGFYHLDCKFQDFNFIY